MAAANPYGKGVIGLLKKGWHEIPGVMGSNFMGLVGIALGSYGIYKYEQKKNYAPTYKRTYTVYRPDDPRVNKPTHDWV